MQQINSPLNAAEYLDAMKSKMGSPFSFFNERFTGCFLGSFFYVTHHAEYQWDRRFSNPKNAVLGYVRSADDGCRIRFVSFRGLLCPGQFLMTLLLCFLAGTIVIWYNNAFDFISLPLLFGLILAFVAISAPISALFESMTERSEEGCNTLLSILYDPKNNY